MTTRVRNRPSKQGNPTAGTSLGRQRPGVRWFIPVLVALLLGSTAGAQDWWYTVRPGDNLWTISETYLLSMAHWRPLGRINQLPDPDYIAPGTRLRIPTAWLKVRPVTVEVLAVTGTARMTGHDGQQRTVQAGMRLDSGDRVSTTEDSSLSLRFADGSTLLLQENASLVLDTLSAYGDTGMVDTRLRLQQGRADHQVFPNPGGASYRVDTPAARAAVRGTDFRVATDDHHGTRTEALEGTVVLTGESRSVTLTARQGAVVRPGQMPTRPVPLLPAPDPSRIPRVVHSTPVSLPLPPLAGGALAYRLQISTDAAFRSLLHDVVIDTPQWELPILADGDYQLRLRSIDARGLEGMDASVPLRINIHPVSPALLKPGFDAMVAEARPRFGWAAIEGVDAYSFRLSPAYAPDTVLYQRDGLHSTELRLGQDLPPGDYFWRVAAMDRDGRGPYSDPQLFRRTPPHPDAEPPVIDSDRLNLRWSVGQPGERYRIQFARDWTFQDILVEQVVERPEITLPRPLSGMYFLRIQVIDPDGRVAPMGPKQRIVVPHAPRSPALLLPLLLLPLL